MSLFQKSKVSVFAVLCLTAAAVFCACSAPEPEVLVPTETIVIRNIPKELRNTRVGAADTATKTAFKVFAQLSLGREMSDGSAAEGETKLTTEITEANTFNVIIALKDPDTGEQFSSTAWNNLCILVAPEDTDTIFDINTKGAQAGPSSTSTVTLDWNKMMPFGPMVNIGDYTRLYGTEDDYNDGFGVILGDPDIEAGGGDKELATNVTDWTDFKNSRADGY